MCESENVAKLNDAGQCSQDSVADNVWRELDINFIPADRLAGLIMALILAVIMTGGIIYLICVDVAPLWIDVCLAVVSAGLIGLLFIYVIKWPRVVYRRISYRVDKSGIEICKGVIWRKVISIPRSRIQHTDLTQGPIERKYGLSKLIIYTAGVIYSKVELEGLKTGTAADIRDFLIAESRTDAIRRV